MQNTASRNAERLARELDEIVIICACSGWNWQTLAKFESSRMLTAKSDLPVTGNFYISATGRCILSLFSGQELDQYFRHFRLPNAEEWPEAETHDGMLAALERIRRNGYELYDTGMGIIGVGAVIRSSGYSAPGSIGIIIPDSRFAGGHRNAVLKGILAAAENIAKARR